MNQAIRKLSGLLVLPVLLAALLLMPVRAHAEETADTPEYNNDYACDVTLPVNMKLNGDHSEAFEVVLETDVEKNQGAEVPMPTDNKTKLSLKKDESDGFTMHYTEPGDYFYKVSQTAGKTPYMTYDDTVYYVQIQITNTDDYLDLKSQVVVTTAEDAENKQSEVSFLNTYAPPAPAVTPKPTATPAPVAPTATPTGAFTLPQTGDTMPLITVLVVMLVAAAALVVLFVARKRKNNGK